MINRLTTKITPVRVLFLCDRLLFGAEFAGKVCEIETTNATDNWEERVSCKSLTDAAHDFAEVFTSGWEDLEHHCGCRVEEEVIVKTEESGRSNVTNQNCKHDTAGNSSCEGENTALVLEGASEEERDNDSAHQLDHSGDPELAIADCGHGRQSIGGLATS